MNKWLRLNCLRMDPPLLITQDIQALIQSNRTIGENYVDPVKQVNPPSLPLFSGADPTPKDEANYEQWLFQARGALNSHTEEAV